MSQSTLSGNSTAGVFAQGGAIYARDSSAVTVSQSTLSANAATGNDGAGGALYAAYSSPLSISNSIIAGNTANYAPDVRKSFNGAFTVTNSLIGRNNGTGLTATSVTTPGANGNFVGGGTDTTKIDPKLGPLASNGGPTQTHALLIGSLAINGGKNADALDVTQVGTPALITDQRGNPVARIVNTTVDMGAYELFTAQNPIVVSTAVDNDVIDGDLSLREAIVLANSSPGDNTITFAPSTNGMEIDLSLGQMEISETVTITGNGAVVTVIDAQQNSRIFDITSTAGNVTLSSLHLKKGKTTASDSAGGGGAVRSLSSGTLDIKQSTLSGNSTAGDNAYGGAIYALAGAVTVSQSTLSGNSTAGDNAYGGAIFASSGAVTVSQSTLSGNSTTGDNAQGGAIFARFGAVTVSQSTLTLNRATRSTGGAIFSDSSPLTIRNSIVAGNTDAEPAADVRKSPDGADAFTVTNSLIGRSNGTGLTATTRSTPDSNGNFVGGDTDTTKIDPKLGPLASNGGPTQTHALVTGSLAIDRGSNAAAVDVTQVGTPALITDQRGSGFTRVLDGDHLTSAVVDMGAFEFSGLRVISPNPNAFTLRPTFQWTPIAGAVSYNIQINNDSTGVAKFHEGTSTTATYTPPANLAIGKFKMWVRPNFASGPGNWSPQHLFNNLTPVTWTTMSRTQLTSRPTLNWIALPGAAKYDLWADNFSTGQKQLIRQEVTGTTFTPATDLPMGVYRFWIRGIDAKGNFAGWSVLQEFLVVPGPTPVGPLSATFDRTPTFSWNAVAGAVSYELYVRNTNSGTNVINGTSVTGTSFTPATNLTDGPYRWWTVAVSQAFSTGAIKSGGSNPVDLYVGGRTTITSPANSSSTADRTPTFTWRAVDGAVRYELLVNRINVTQAGIINQTSLTTTSFTPATDLPAGTYRAWVTSVSSTNERSPFSLQVEFTVTETKPEADGRQFDYQLAGLLVSELSENNQLIDGESTSEKRHRELVREQRQGNAVDVPVTEEKEIPHVDLDRWMMSFDMFELDLSHRQSVRPSSVSQTVVQLLER